MQVHIGSIFFNPNGFIPEGEGFTLTPTLIHPRSRGCIKLRSSDPFDKPLIIANYLTDPEGYDLNQLVEGLKLVRRLGNQMVRSVPLCVFLVITMSLSFSHLFPKRHT